MTQHERDTLVESYLGGEMTPDQESNFFLQVALDSELQRTLKAYRIMNQALDRERSESIASRSNYRESVMSLLAVTKAATVAGTAVTAAKGISSATSGGSVAGAGTVSVAGLGIGLKVLLATIVGASLVVGTIFVVDAVTSKDEPTTGGQMPSTEQQLQQKPALAPPTLETPSATSNEIPSKEIPGKENATPSTSGERNEIRSSATSKVREGEKRGSVQSQEEKKYLQNPSIVLSPLSNTPEGKLDIKVPPKKDLRQDR